MNDFQNILDRNLCLSNLVSEDDVWQWLVGKTWEGGLDDFVSLSLQQKNLFLIKINQKSQRFIPETDSSTAGQQIASFCTIKSSGSHWFNFAS